MALTPGAVAECSPCLRLLDSVTATVTGSGFRSLYTFYTLYTGRAEISHLASSTGARIRWDDNLQPATYKLLQGDDAS